MNKLISINNFQQNYNNSNKIYARQNLHTSNVNFGNKIAIPYSASREHLERRYTKVEMLLRRGLNKFGSLFNPKKDVALQQKILALQEDSPAFMHVLFDLGRSVAKGKTVEVNVESERLRRIVESDEACIFIMNHSNQVQDPRMLGFFNSMLAREYILNEKSSHCPRPKILLNKDILEAMDPGQRACFEKIGAVGIDASLFGADSTQNAKTLLPVMKRFIRDKAHIFVFPEGKMCIFDQLGLEYKFQTGIAEIVSGMAKAKKRVKVVPLGFAYRKDLGSIHIGEPVYFKRDGVNMLVTRGNIDSSFASNDYVDFFGKGAVDEDKFKLLTAKGVPVVGKEVSDYVSGVLCENLRICIDEAAQAIKPSHSKGKDQVHHIS